MAPASRSPLSSGRVAGAIAAVPRKAITLVATLSLATAAAAADGPANPDDALTLALERIPGDPLALQEVVDAALAQAAPVWVAAAELRAAAGEVERERGRFEPEWYLDLERVAVDEPSASPFSGADVVELDQTRAETGVSLSLPTGTELEASLVTVRQETNSMFATLDPQYSSTSEFRFVQELLGGPVHRDLSAAQQHLQAAEARREQADHWARARAEILYWDLYASIRDLAVQQLLRDRALALLRQVESRADAGLVGPVQVANARVFLATQELELIDREEALDALSDALAAFIDRRPRSQRFRPLDHPPAAADLGPVEPILADARARNRSLAAARADIAALKSLAAAARGDRLPRAYVTGTLAGNGISGVGRNVLFNADTTAAAYTGGLSRSLSRSLSGDFPSWELGLRVQIPLGNSGDRGEHRRLLAELDRLAHAYDEAARKLEAEIRGHYRALVNGTARLAAARAAVDAANEQVRIGRIEYDNGRSTAFELVRLGSDLAAAQQTYSQALVGSARARANLRYLTAGLHPAPGPATTQQRAGG